MNSRFHRKLLSAVLGVGLTVGLTATATAAVPSNVRQPPRDQSTLITLRLGYDPAGVATAEYPQVVLDSWSFDPSILRSQYWYLIGRGAGSYEIKSYSNGRCMKWDPPQGEVGRVALRECQSSDSEFWWRFIPVGPGFQVQMPKGRCLNVEGGPYADHKLITFPCEKGGARNDVWLPAWQQA